MNIIFGDAINKIPDSYVVLELDTIKVMPQDKKIKTFCVIEKVSMEEFMNLEKQKAFHAKLLEDYRQKNWKNCKTLISVLKGCWTGELDSFYDEIESRVDEFRSNPPPDDWDGTLIRIV
jgi:adenylate cyclase